MRQAAAEGVSNATSTAGLMLREASCRADSTLRRRADDDTMMIFRVDFDTTLAHARAASSTWAYYFGQMIAH